MSTRSGKRIHSSFCENASDTMKEDNHKSERKTRSKRPKENRDDLKPAKSKKRHNYVSYPEGKQTLQIFNEEELSVPTRATLREQDLNVSKDNNPADSVVDSGKMTRQSRRTKKFSENAVEGVLENEDVEKIVKNKKKSKKKNKKNMAKSETVVESVEEAVQIAKKKKGKVNKNVANETLNQVSAQNTTLDKSNGSIDSFHSAAGSPVAEAPIKEAEKPNMSLGKSPRRASKRLLNGSYMGSENVSLNEVFNSSSKRAKLSIEQIKTPVKSPRTSRSKGSGSVKKNSTFDKSNGNIEEVLNATFEKESSKKNTSCIKNETNEKAESTEIKFNSTYEKDNTPEKLNITYEEHNKSKRKSLRSSTIDQVDKQVDKVSLNTTFEKPKSSSPDILNNTYEKDEKLKRESLRQKTGVESQVDKASLNSTIQKPKSSTPDKLNTTYEEDSKSRRKSRRLTNLEKPDENTSLNSTFEKTKTSNESTINTTFDKETKLDSTFDKTETKSITNSTKSSLISSDATLNVTFDKSDDNSRISITSDDSRTENIVNTTPVLIESSLDESQIEPSPKEKTPQNDKPQTLATPLKREGTFTKDGPEVIMSPKPKLSTEKTPTKSMSLPSPGCTPFHFSKSSQKEKSIMNLTCSIEKPGRRSSLAEPVRRATKVMFCSPVNNPAVVQQQKRKVIKSNLKGSNKSFIFDESVSEVVRPAARKRSYTHNDADDARAKRTRLTATLQQCTDRLSRPRTASVTVKLPEPSTPSKKLLTPSKKNLTPSKAKSEPKLARTKLPNFAALHQKEFAKMESLDECQERRARRAKQLLTPTGSMVVVERSSPKTRGTAIDSVKAVKEAAKKDTPTKVPKLPTLESLRPGFTRFGFKMNLDVNPFSVPPKPDPKPREKKPNGILTRLPSHPSLAGTTTRKEVARQTVMREKSFTSLSDRRDLKRKENRTMIKGVRTNRRFELQMQMRNVNA